MSTASPLAFFSNLGDAIDARWRAAHYDTAVFSRLAVEALEGPLVERQLDPFALASEAISVPTLPGQGDLSRTFGQPPLTVFRNERFFIEVLFWFTSTTAIHQHSFTGAFHVLHGSSVHTEFDFVIDQRVSDELLTGRLTRRRCEVLATGATRAIAAGPRFIHSLFHMDQPSVSVVVRADVRGATPQYLYMPPGIAFDPFYKPPTLMRKLEYLRVVAEARPDEFVELASRTAEGADLASAFRILLGAQEVLPYEVERIRAIVDRIGARFGEPTRSFEAAVGALRRESALRQAREVVKDTELRFCLALLLTADDRDTLLQLVGERFSDGAPAARVAAWVRRLGDAGTYGFQKLSDDEVQVLQQSLEGRSPDELAAKLGGGEAARATEIVQRLQRTEVIRPLFA
jgi:hypothetical protein